MARSTTLQNSSRPIINTLEENHKYDMPTYRRLSVEANAVNQFITPQYENPAEGSAYKLAEALKMAQPSINKAMAELDEKRKEQERADDAQVLMMAESEQGARLFAERFGDAPPTNNPMVKLKFDNTVGKKEGEDFNLYLKNEYEQRGMGNSTTPEDFTKFVDESREKYFKEKQIIQRYQDSVGYAAGFEAVSQNYLKQLQGHHIDSANKNITKEIGRGHVAELLSVAPILKTPTGNADTEEIAHLFNVKSAPLYAGKMVSGSALNQMNVEVLTKLAIDSRDPSILDAAENIKAGSGSLSGTAEFLTKKSEALKQIDAAIRADQREEKQAKRDQVELLQDEVANALEAKGNPKKLLDDPRFDKLGEIEKRRLITNYTTSYQRFQRGDGARWDNDAADHARTVAEEAMRTGDPLAISRAKFSLLTTFAGNKSAKPAITEMFKEGSKFSAPWKDESYVSELSKVRLANSNSEGLGLSTWAGAKKGFEDKWKTVYRMSGDELANEFEDLIPKEYHGRMMYAMPVTVKEKVLEQISKPYIKQTGIKGGVASASRPLSNNPTATLKTGEALVTPNGFTVKKTGD